MNEQAASTEQPTGSSPGSNAGEGAPRPATPPKPTERRYLFAAVRTFTADCAAIREMHQVIAPILAKRIDDLELEITELDPPVPTGEGEAKEVSEAWVRSFMKIASTFRRRARAAILNSERAVIGLVTCLEELFSQLATAFYSLKPEALAGLNKKIDYADLMKFATMEEVVAGLMEKELSALSRDSHYDQLKFLDETLKLGLRETFEGWNQLAEICARRNLYVHTGGKVNDVYLRTAAANLQENNTDPPKRGEYLHCTEQYLEDAYGCVLEAGIQAGVSTMRRLFADKLSSADHTLADIGFELLMDEEWTLAERVNRYACRTPAKWVSTDEFAKIFLVNRCIALNQLGRTGETRTVLGKIDWSSVSRKFILARQVLCGEHEAAGQTMRQTNDEDVNEHSFRTWPLFREFRETAEFKAAFEARFGKPYEPAVPEGAKAEAVAAAAAAAATFAPAAATPAAATGGPAMPVAAAAAPSLPAGLVKGGDDAVEAPAPA